MATTLLLVHSDRAVVDGLVSQFAAPALAGQFQVHGATTLEEALGAFEAQTIDVLVSDLVVAGTDGVQLAQFARSRFPSLQVVFTTQTASAEAEGRVRSIGGLGLIAAPITAEAIVAQLQAQAAPVAPAAPAAPAVTPTARTAVAKPVPAATAVPKVSVTPQVATGPRAVVKPAATAVPKAVAKVAPQPSAPSVQPDAPTVMAQKPPMPRHVVAQPTATPVSPQAKTVAAKAPPPPPPSPAQPRVATVQAKAVPPPASSAVPTPPAARPPMPAPVAKALAVAPAAQPAAAPPAQQPVQAPAAPAGTPPQPVATTPPVPRPPSVVAKAVAPASATPPAPAVAPPAPAQPRPPTVVAKAVPPPPSAPPAVPPPPRPATVVAKAAPAVAQPPAPPAPPQPRPPTVVAKAAPPSAQPAQAPHPPAPRPATATAKPIPAVAKPASPAPSRVQAAAPPLPPTVPGGSMIGAIVGPYRIKRQIGQGRWGRVYEAVQEEVNRCVTIKVLDAQIQQDEARAAQFTSLASRLANLRHNNMVAVYEAGQDGDTRYYAREYITGRTIADIAGAGETLGPSPILKVLVGVARALTYLTQHNVAFGPVPDRNILVDNANGEGRIAGFSFLDGSSGPLGSTVTEEVVRVAQMLWTVLDPAAPQAQQVYTMLARVLGQGQPFQSIEQLVNEAEALEQTFHKPVVKPKPKPSSAYRAVAPTLILEEKPWLQRHKMHLVIGAGVAVVAVVAFFATQFFIQQSKTLPPADVDSFCRVPAGEFIYQDGDKKTTKEFWISKYEVTFGQYKKFWLVVKTKGDAEYAHPKQPKNKDTSHTPSDWDEVLDACQKGIALSVDGRPTTEDYPVFGVDYFDAYAYAKWAGGRLPTEEEWEKAARGLKGNLYPWGNTFDNPKLANTGKDGDDISRGSIDGYVRWAPVHAHRGDANHPGDVSPWGVCDMAGNVSEWTDSWVPMKLDPKTQTPVIRGGSYADPDVRVTQRLTSFLPTKRDRYIGFRIVRDQAPPQTPAK